MGKDAFIEQIKKKFTAMGLSYQTGQGTDISIATELLDAKWGSGKKKISYEASIYADESSKIVFMWEMTKEIGSGFSFGASSETTFQSGTTVFRKMKSIQYGPDGKAYEYSLDLGAIPKAVKETASDHGWTFKTVLTKKKALWPEGSSTTTATPQVIESKPKVSAAQASEGTAVFCTNCGQSLFPEDQYCSECGTKKSTIGTRQRDSSYQEQRSFPDKSDNPPTALTAKGKFGLLFWIFWSFLCLLDGLMFLGGSGPLFLVLASIVLIGLFSLRTRLSHSVIKLIGAFVGALFLTFILFALTAGGSEDKLKETSADRGAQADGKHMQNIPSAGKPISPEQAKGLLREYPEVKKSQKAPAYTPVHIEVMEDRTDQYVLRAYTIVAPDKDLPSHTATFGWYSVNKKTGEIASVIPGQ
jgi:hypothetical protein